MSKYIVLKPSDYKKLLEGRKYIMTKALPEKPEDLEDTNAHKTPPKGYPKKKKEYADPNEYKYPLDDAEHVRAAITYFSKPKNYGMYSESERKSMWARIVRAAKEHGIELSEKHKFSKAIKERLAPMVRILNPLRGAFELKHGTDDDDNFDKSELARGIIVEREHTSDDDIAKQIAKAHLTEIPDYYTRLEEMEDAAKSAGQITNPKIIKQALLISMADNPEITGDFIHKFSLRNNFAKETVMNCFMALMYISNTVRNTAIDRSTDQDAKHSVAIRGVQPDYEEGMMISHKSNNPKYKLIMIKGGVHKYIRREGEPGNYTYYYENEKGEETTTKNEEELPKNKAHIEGYWNGTVYGDEKKGYRVYIDNTEHKITKEQAEFLKTAPKAKISIDVAFKNAVSGKISDNQVKARHAITDLVAVSELEIPKIGKVFGFRFPYNATAVEWMHDLKGVWVAEKKRWYVKAENYEKVASTIEKLKNLFPNQTTNTPKETEPLASAPKKLQSNRIYGGGSGYGATPYHPGEILRNPANKDEIVKVVKPISQHFKEDGMSFGVGDDEGYLFSAIVEPVSKEEAEAFVAQEKKNEEEKVAKTEKAKMKNTLTNYIRENGVKPDGTNVPEGEKLLDTENIYGGGDWFVIGKDYIWYVKNNGADGDSWSWNNVRTGGAGAIGWRIPFDEKIAGQLRSIQKSMRPPRMILTKGGYQPIGSKIKIDGREYVKISNTDWRLL